MLDIKFVRENPELVKENIKKKFQDSKLLLVDEVIALDAEYRAAITEGDGLRRRTIEEANYSVIIPMAGYVDSLNVAAASAVACWELRVR